jgi:hypothetical protein
MSDTDLTDTDEAVTPPVPRRFWDENAGEMFTPGESYGPSDDEGEGEMVGNSSSRDEGNGGRDRGREACRGRIMNFLAETSPPPTPATDPTPAEVAAADAAASKNKRAAHKSGHTPALTNQLATFSPVTRQGNARGEKGRLLTQH